MRTETERETPSTHCPVIATGVTLSTVHGQADEISTNTCAHGPAEDAEQREREAVTRLSPPPYQSTLCSPAGVH